MELSQIETYKEACATFRHYSQSALHIRISAIAQCIVLVTAIGYLLKEGSFVFSAYAAGFGLLFTLTLLVLHDNYQRKCSLFILACTEMEESFDLPISPVGTLKKDHDNHAHSFTGELLITKGLFLLMLLAFAFLFIQGLIRL